MVIKGIYVHLSLLETFCYLADENSTSILLEIIQQPPPPTQGDALSHLRDTFSAVAMTYSWLQALTIATRSLALQLCSRKNLK